MDNLKGKKVAILVDNGFEQVEMTEPRKALNDAGADAKLISPQQEQVQGWDHTKWGDSFEVELPLDKAKPDEFDALVLPGGVMNPDHLRMNPKAVEFVKAFFDAKKPVAAICQGPWTVIEAGAAKGRKITSWPSLKTDLKNAGADWVDEEVVVDHNLVTSRKPADIPAFNREMLNLFGRTQTQKQKRGRAA